VIGALLCSKALFSGDFPIIILPFRVSNKQPIRTALSAGTSGRIWLRDRTLIAKLSMVTPQEKATSQDILHIKIMSASIYMDANPCLTCFLTMWKRSVSLLVDHLECDPYALTSSSRTSNPTSYPISYLTHLGRIYLELRSSEEMAVTMPWDTPKV
jgi:hypothetical protein